MAVLSYNFWRRHYNSDPSIVGRNIQLVHKDYTVLGVLPPRFTWMDGDVYLPLKMSQAQDVTYNANLKLRSGVSVEAAEAEMPPDPTVRQGKAQLLSCTVSNQPSKNGRVLCARPSRHTSSAVRGRRFTAGDRLRQCFDSASGPGSARQHELAVRSAVGASRFRIVRQLLTESLLLSLIGAGLGVVLAYRALGFIVARLPEYSFPHEADFHVNLPVLLFSVSLAVFSGVLFGVFPSLESARREINHVIQAGTHKMAGSVRGKRMHTGLIAGQIALTLILLTGAGAAVRGFSRMMRRPLGYDPHQVMSVGIPVHENTLNGWAERAAYFTQLRERVAAMPGVISAGISTNATPPSNGWPQPFEILGKSAAEQQEARANFVSPEYFTILHIPLVEGRLWEQSEVSRAPLRSSTIFVRRYFPGEDVLATGAHASISPPNRPTG